MKNYAELKCKQKIKSTREIVLTRKRCAFTKTAKSSIPNGLGGCTAQKDHFWAPRKAGAHNWKTLKIIPRASRVRFQSARLLALFSGQKYGTVPERVREHVSWNLAGSPDPHTSPVSNGSAEPTVQEYNETGHSLGSESYPRQSVQVGSTNTAVLDYWSSKSYRPLRRWREVPMAMATGAMADPSTAVFTSS
jgi:hypothetical protein